MEKRVMCILIAIVIVSLTFSSIPRILGQTEDIKVTNYSYYVDSSGVLDVTGEIQNVGVNTIASVDLRGSIFDENGLDVSDSFTTAWVAYIVPQQKAPFMMEFAPPQDDNTWEPGDVTNVQLSVAQANATSEYQYPDLKITSSTPSIGTSGDYNGAYGVSGEIENTGSQTATNITVVGEFYNSTGSVVGVGYTTYLTPNNLAPSAKTTFQIYALDLNQSEVPSYLKIASYSLLVQTQLPILQGSAPSVTPYQGSGSPVAGNDSTAKSLNLTLVAAIAVVVVLAVVGVIVVLKRRKPQETKIVVVPRKTGSRRDR
ncbi:MAG: FxLYD domain-containing protein [Candidatus Bathyarchaeia archaeon]|jgi:hypothetical protein